MKEKELDRIFQDMMGEVCGAQFVDATPIDEKELKILHKATHERYSQRFDTRDGRRTESGYEAK